MNQPIFSICEFVPMPEPSVLLDWWDEMGEAGIEGYEDCGADSSLYEGIDRYDAEDITCMDCME